MKRIIVLGCPGSGKSVFSRKLRDATSLPLYHLDNLLYNPDKTKVSREEFNLKLYEILKNDTWIIDGNYRRTIEPRLKMCDTVFLFDIDTNECLSGVESRIGKQHDDLPWTEEGRDEEFIKFISSFKTDVLPDIMDRIEKVKENKKVYIFKTRKEADNFISIIMK